MKTQGLLLSIATLAAGIICSRAQSNVYSVNVVGYVNVVLKTNAYNLVGNPFDATLGGTGPGSNTLIGLVGAVLPNKSQVLLWNAGSQSYVTAQKIAGVWNTDPAIPPGTGFFVRPGPSGTDITNTFVGSVIVSPDGGTNSVSLPAGYYLATSPIPFNGFLNDGGTNTINLGPVLPTKSQVLTWNPTTQSYITAQKIAGVWSTNLPLAPGQGYFIKAQWATNWPQTLDIQ